MKNKITSQIIVMGVFIFCLFIYIVTVNIIDNSNSSNNFFSKGKDVDARIENFYLSKDKLIVEVSGNAKAVCIKSTRSNPTSSSICWKDVNNNIVTTNIFDYKRYYIWIKDINDNISDSVVYSP